MRGPLLAVAAACAALLLAAPADAGVRTFRLGTFEIKFGYGDLDRMDDANVRSLRFNFPWGRIEQRRGSGSNCGVYDWSGPDLVVSAASDRGIKLLPVVVGSPDYAASKSSRHPSTSSPAIIDDYKCFLRAAVRRYGRGGTYFRCTDPPGCDPSAKPIEEWQIYNEPNVKAYAVKVDPLEYGRFLKLSHNVIAGVDDQAIVVMAGMPETPNVGMNIHPYLKKLYRVRGIKQKFDVVALHPYARNEDGVKGALIRLRDTLRDLRDRRRYIWVTEIGFASYGPKGHPFVSSEQGQADRLTRTIRMLRANRTRYKVGTVHWFRWRDTLPPDRRGEWNDHTGLFRRNGTVKPACRRYVAFTNGVCRAIDDSAGAALPGTTVLPTREAQIVPSAPE